MKRILTMLLSIILLMTTIPGTSIVALATEVDDMISVAETENDSIETNDEETKVSTEFETINVEAGRPQYFASSNSEIVLPESAQITRAEWLHNLVVVFEMTVESESLPDNYFTDLTDTHKYYDDILLAVEFGVVNIGVGEELKPDEGLTRDFAVSTLNFCLGYQLGENPTYTFADSADCTDPNSAQIAVDRGWFELVDGCFLPESFVTTEEAESMLNDSGSVIQGQIVDENYESTYTFAEDVIVIPDGTVVSEDEEGKIHITDCPENISVGDKFAVYLNGIPVFYKATSVSVSDNITTFEVEDLELEETLLSVDAQGVISADAMEIIPEDGVEVTVEDDSPVSGYAIKKLHKIQAKKEITLGGVTGQVFVVIKNPYVDYVVNSGRAYVALCGDTEITYRFSASAAQVAGGNSALTLFSCNVGGVGKFAVTINVDLSGSASGIIKGKLVAGVECEKKGKLRVIKNFNQTESYTNIEAEASVKLVASLSVVELNFIKGNIYAEVGMKANFSKKTYQDEKTPKTCSHFAAYLFASYGASVSVKFFDWSISESVSYSIFNESNSPVRIVGHYEDGQIVPKCTRGNTYPNYYTKSSSRWSGCGWTGANGAYALNDDGSYFALYDYTLDENNRATITKYNGNSWSVYIPEEIDGYTVVAIGSYAFRYKNVRNVVIPDTVTSIGSEAFRYCYYLTNVTIPDSVKEIGSCAFYECSSLSSVTLPSSLETLSYAAFSECISLTSVKIPDSITVINDSVFADCYNLRSVTLPKTITQIGDYAFANTAISSIYIPKTLESCGGSQHYYDFNGTEYYINSGPFYGCENLNNVTFEQGAERVASYLFAGCVGLKSISLPDTITTIEYGAFQYCLRLNSVDLNEFVTTIESSAFRCCVSLPEVKIPDSVTSLGEYAFDKCTSLKSVVLSKGLLSLGCGAFSNTLIETIEIPKSLDNCWADYSLYGNGYTYELDGTNYMIGWGPFYCCENLKTVTFEKGTTQIAQSLFTGCTGLEEIIIPNTVTVIESSAFRDCLNLKNLTIGNSVTTIGSNAFNQCIKISEVVIPNSVNTINEYAFDECSLLNQVTLSNNLKTMDSGAFSRTAIEKIAIPKSLDNCWADYSLYGNGYIYELDGTSYMIGWGPFYCCENLKTVTFEKGITQIAKSLFTGCTGLEEIIIPDTVKDIESYAFSGCLRLKKVNVANSVETIGESAFERCVSLTNINIPTQVSNIGSYAFSECSSLETIEVPNKNAIINSRVFSGCISLKNVTLPEKLAKISGCIFYDCTSLEKVKLPETIESIGYYAFYGCTALKEITIPEKVKEIGYSAFENCTALEKVYIPQSTKTIGYNTFMGCESLKDVTISDYSIKKLESNIFKNCPSIQKITLPKGLTTIGAEAFVNDTGLVEVVIPESVTTIDSNAFSYPDKTVISGKTGSYAETFANENGFTFKNSYVAGEGISLLDGVEYVVIDRGETYRAKFEYFPENANDVITLTANSSNVNIDGHDIRPYYSGDMLITATATSGVTYEFTLHTRDARSISVAKQPTKTSYLIGEKLDLSGIVIEVLYDDDSTRNVTDYEVSGFDSSVEGECEVTVKWKSADGYTYTTTFNVDIIDTRPKVTGISIETMPTKRQYERKESLDLTGMVVVATYTDNSEVVITDYTVSGYNALKNGVQTITVSYNGFTTTFTVTVGQTEHEHSYTSTVTKQPTCKETGVKTFTCSCGDSYTETLLATGHTEVTVTGKAATCTATGLTDGKKCSVCGTTTVAQQTIAKKGHTEVTVTGKAATCTATGLTEGKKCSLCGTVTKAQETIKAKGHTTSVINKKDATCTVDGYTGDTYCSTCKTTVTKGTAITKLGHSYNAGVITTKATCEKDGVKTFTCTRCKDTKTETIKATGHKEVVIPAVAPTYTTVGKTEGKKCSVCGTVTVAQKEVAKLILATPVVTVKNSGTGVKVTWKAIDGAESYKVYRKTYSTKNKKYGSWKTCGTAKTTSYVDATAKSGTKYIYTVKALNGETKSGIKSSSSILFLSQPTVKIANNASGVKVSWNKITGATGYKVYRSEYTNGKWSGWKSVKTIDKGSTVSWTDKSAKSGVKYKYTVKAVNGKTASTYKSSSSLLYLVQPKTTVKAVSNGVKVTWTQITGATSYNVYRSEYNAKTKKWSSWKGIKTAKSTSKSYTDKTVKKGVKYRYAVKAVNGKVSSTYKASSSVKR